MSSMRKQLHLRLPMRHLSSLLSQKKRRRLPNNLLLQPNSITDQQLCFKETSRKVSTSTGASTQLSMESRSNASISSSMPTPSTPTLMTEARKTPSSPSCRRCKKKKSDRRATSACLRMKRKIPKRAGTESVQKSSTGGLVMRSATSSSDEP